MTYKLPELKAAAIAGGKRLESIPGDHQLIQDALIGTPDVVRSGNPTDAEKKRVLPALKKIKRRIEDNCQTHIEVMVLLETMMFVWVEEEWKDHPLNPPKSHKSVHCTVSRNLEHLKHRLSCRYSQEYVFVDYGVYKDQWEPNTAKLRAAEKRRAEEANSGYRIVTRSFLEFHPDMPAKATKASPEKRKGLVQTTLSENSPAKKTKKAPASILKDAVDGYSPAGDYAAFSQDAACALKSWIELCGVQEKDAKTRCWQVRCIAEDPSYGRERLRVLLVTGATPMFALTKFVAEAFGWRPSGKDFDPSMTKGVVPPGSHWTVERDEGPETQRAGIIGTQSAAYKAAGKGAPFFHDKKVKVFQLLRKRGDTLSYRCDGGRQVTLRLDGMESKPNYNQARYSPKLVGADSWSIGKYAWSNLNDRFLQNKPDEWVLTSSDLTEEERQDALDNRYKIPLFDSKGDKIDKRNNGCEAVARAHEAVALPFVE